MHFDFTIPKGLKIHVPPRDEQNIEMCMEKKIREWEKKY